jgi:hypothetical protein
VGSDQVPASLTDELPRSFPSLVGEEGIDSDQLRAIAQASSLVLMLYSTTKAMGAVAAFIQHIFGDPNDPRNFVKGKLRLVGWVVVIAPISLMLVAAVSGLAKEWPFVGEDNIAAQVLVGVGPLAVSLCVDTLIVHLRLTQLAGIRRSRWTGTVVGGFGFSSPIYLQAVMVSWAVSKPEYGACAMPSLPCRGCICRFWSSMLARLESRRCPTAWLRRRPLQTAIPITRLANQCHRSRRWSFPARSSGR